MIVRGYGGGYELTRSPNIATYEGLRAYGKAIRKSERAQPSFGNGNRPLWRRRSLSAYTWMRTNRGPQREWLHCIGKIDSPLCDYGEVQSGDHLTFSCPAHHIARQALLGTGKHTWESLDPPRYHDGGGGQEHNLVEEFFSYIFAHFN